MENLVGQRIITHDCTWSIKRVISAVNLGEGGKSNWHIEFIDGCNQYHYWIQEIDNGRLVYP